MILRRFVFFWLFWLSANSLLPVAYGGFEKCINQDQVNLLWEDLYQVIYHHPKLIYHDTFPTDVTSSRPGWVSSNEDHFYWMMESIPSTPGDIHLGFGTNINFNLLAVRPGQRDPLTGIENVRTSILVDQSPEVIATLLSFWRPLFLISNTPVEFLGNLARYPVDSSTTISEIFQYTLNRLKVSSDRTEDVRRFQEDMDRFRNKEVAPYLETIQKLKRLIDQGKISEAEVEFFARILEQEMEFCPSIFKNSYKGNSSESHFSEALTFLYNPTFQGEMHTLKTKQTKKVMESMSQFFRFEIPSDEEVQNSRIQIEELIKKSSFLENSEFFQRVRSVFLNDQDYYVLSEIENYEFWDRVTDFAKNKSQKVTDVYLTCIPGVIKSSQPNSDIDEDLERNISMLPGDNIYVYESTCLSESPTIQVKKMTSIVPN